MSMIYLTGKHANLLRRATLTAGPSSALAAYPAENVCDNDPSTPMVFGSIVADSNIKAILNPFTNPSFESALSTGWTDASVAGGTATRVNTAGHVNSGTYGCDLVAVDPTHGGAVYQDIEAAAGEYRQFGLFAKTISGTPSLALTIYNRTTGKYWNGTTWTATPSSATTVGTLSGSFSFIYAQYRVEDYDTCRSDTVTMKLQVSNVSAAASTVAVDDIEDVPGVNFAAVFGHNLGNVLTGVNIEYDASGTFGGGRTVASTMTVARNCFYSTFSIAYTSPWRFIGYGTNHDEPYIGELVLGQYQTAAAFPDWGFKVSRQIPGVRQTGPGRRAFVYNFSSEPTEDLELEFSARTAAQSAELANSLWHRSGQGRYPTIIVPINTETSMYYGRLMEPHTIERPFQGVYDTKLMLQGDPMPTVGS